MTELTSTQLEQTPIEQTPQALTPTFRQFMRRNWFWFAAAGFAIVISLIVLWTSGMVQNTERLATDNTRANGSQAVFKVLENQGVTTHSAHSLAELKGLSETLGKDELTVLFYDSRQFLKPEQLAELATLSKKLVLVEPNYQTLQKLAPKVLSGGVVSESPLTAKCQLPAASKASTISGTKQGYRSSAPDSINCFADSNDSFSVIQLPAPSNSGQELTILGAGDLLTNGEILSYHNAALAIWLLGSTENLVWYIPGLDDVPASTPTLGELTPNWLNPLILLLVFVILAAGIWQGRRQGKLVTENLPVVIPANEIVEGRARLYQKAGILLESADALRLGTLHRLSSVLGLSKTASVSEIITAASEQTGLQPERLHQVLVAEIPNSDQQLMKISDELLALEEQCRQAVNPLNPKSQTAIGVAPQLPTQATKETDQNRKP